LVLGPFGFGHFFPDLSPTIFDPAVSGEHDHDHAVVVSVHEK
jgi:hypothetical protein